MRRGRVLAHPWPLCEWPWSAVQALPSPCECECFGCSAAACEWPWSSVHGLPSPCECECFGCSSATYPWSCVQGTPPVTDVDRKS